MLKKRLTVEGTADEVKCPICFGPTMLRVKFNDDAFNPVWYYCVHHGFVERTSIEPCFGD